LRLGGRAAEFIEAEEEPDLVDGARYADSRGERLLILGGGSNLVVPDDGFDGVVLRVATRGVKRMSGPHGTVRLEAAAGEPWDDFVASCIADELAGLEAMCGIPGTVGGTPIQNVGAYGQQVSETIESVRAFDRSANAVVDIPGTECGFAYRQSMFQRDPGRFLVLRVTFSLKRTRIAAGPRLGPGTTSDPSTLGDIRSAVMAARVARGMVLDACDHDTWSVGSFFKNPVLNPVERAELSRRVTERLGEETSVAAAGAGLSLDKPAAGWLIEQAGFPRGYPLALHPDAPVSLSTKHALALTNRGNGTTSELLGLAHDVARGVFEAFGVTLIPEPTLVDIAWRGIHRTSTTRSSGRSSDT
jgi:UDP-N-acetylmuramate dehydrogenase